MANGTDTTGPRGPAGPTGPASTATPSPRPAPAAEPGAAPAPADTSDTSAALTDNQIIQVTHVANLGEIDQARLAESKAKDARVKRMAAMMLRDHKDRRGKKGMSLARKDNLAPIPSPTSTSLSTDAEGNTMTLRAEAGIDFDRSYIANADQGAPGRARYDRHQADAGRPERGPARVPR